MDNPAELQYLLILGPYLCWSYSRGSSADKDTRGILSAAETRLGRVPQQTLSDCRAACCNIWRAATFHIIFVDRNAPVRFYFVDSNGYSMRPVVSDRVPFGSKAVKMRLVGVSKMLSFYASHLPAILRGQEWQGVSTKFLSWVNMVTNFESPKINSN